METTAQLPQKSFDQKFCHGCATPIHASAQFCTACGATQQVQTQMQPIATYPAALPHHGQPAHYPQPAHYSPPAEAYASPIYQQRTMSEQRHCPICGKVIHLSAITCPACGAQQPGAMIASNATNIKSRVTAALLAFFLGGFGAHKFYCGHIGLGFLYLLFFWTWIPAIIAFFEGIIYLVGSNDDTEFTRKYCSV